MNQTVWIITPDTRVMTTPEVAGVLGVSESTVRRWADSGRLPYAIQSNRRVYPQGAVRQLQLGKTAKP